MSSTNATATPDSPAAPASPSGKLDPAVVRIALVLVSGAIAPLLDATIINVALHTLSRSFGASVSEVQWVATGYLLPFGLAVPVSGRAAERLGAKRVWIAALLLFLLGSVLSGLAWNLPSLIGFRVLQGFAAGFSMPVLQTLLMRAAGSRDTLGRLMAVVTVPALIAPIFGPVIGGLIIGHTSWRWLFYVNVPVCLFAALLAWRTLPRDTPSRGQRLDAVGLFLLAPALTGILYGLAVLSSSGAFARAQVLVPLAVGVLLAFAFVAWAWRRPEPLVDVRLFRTRSFGASCALMFISGLSMYGSMLLIPLYYQQVRGEDVVMTGLMMAPQGVGSLLARSAGILTDRIGPRPVLFASILFTAVGTVPFVLSTHGMNAVLLGAGLVVRGAGLSAANLAVMVGAYQDLDKAKIPHASAATRIAQQVGASFGAAVIVVVLSRQTAAHPGAAGAPVAFGHAFGWALGFTLLALLPALALPRRRPR